MGRFGPSPDAQGRVTFAGLKPDTTYSLEFSAPDAFPVTGPEWTLQPGERRDLGVMRLTVLSGAVAGRVVDEQGRPVAGATVSDVRDAPLKVTATTDANGHFRLPGLEEGDVYLLAQAPGRQIIGCLAHTGQGDLRLTWPQEKPATRGAPLPAATPLADRAQGLALDLLKQAVQETNGQTGWARESLLTGLARLDPEAAAAAVVPGKDNERALTFTAGVGLLKDHFEDALPLLKKADPPRGGTRAESVGFVLAVGAYGRL